MGGIVRAEVAHGQNYRFEVVALRGQTIQDQSLLGAGDLGAIDSLGRGPSINDRGAVAFIAADGTDVRLLLELPGDLILRNERIPNFLVISDEVQVNNRDQIGYRVEWVAGSPTGDLTGNTAVVRQDSLVSPNPLIAGGPLHPPNSPFQFVSPWCSVDNTGRVVVSADLVAAPHTVLVADDDPFGPGADAQSDPVTGFPNLYPKASDDGKTVVRMGGSATSPLVVFLDSEFADWVTVTTTPAFTQVGARPGISDDGRAVSFLADQGSGPGLYMAYFETPTSGWIHRVADLAPSTDLDGAVGVNHAAGHGVADYTLVYLARGPTGLLGLHKIDTDWTNSATPIVSNSVLLAEEGGTIGTFQITVADLDIYDPINERGEIVFWVQTVPGTQAILRAVPDTIELVDPLCFYDGACYGTYLERRLGLVEVTDDVAELAGAAAVRNGVATDGLSTLVVRIPNSTPMTLELLNQFGGSAGPEYGVLELLDGTQSGSMLTNVSPIATAVGSFVMVLYRAPTDFPGTGLFSLPNGLPASVRASDASRTVDKTFRLYPPPVVMIHGIWSDGSAWQGLDDFLRGSGFRICRGCRVNYGRAPNFDPMLSTSDALDRYATRVLSSGIKAALEDYRRAGIAATRADVVAHSMGGLVARAHVAGRDPSDRYARLENYDQGSIHKLITVGTPHLGTPLADLLIENQCNIGQFGRLKEFFESLGRPLGPGLVGLQTNSHAIQNLGKTRVSAHAIVATAPSITRTEGWLDLILTKYVSELLSLDAAMGTSSHDTIVQTVSQAGTLPAFNQTAIPDVVHAAILSADADETKSLEVWLAIRELLTTKTVAADFAPEIPAFVSGGSAIAPPSCLGGSSAAASPLSGTLTPTTGTTVAPGDTVDVTFTPSATNPIDGAIFAIQGYPHAIAGSGPFNFSFEVSDRIGDLNVSALTYGPGPDQWEATSTLVVYPIQPFTSLRMHQEQTLMRGLGMIEAARVFAEFEDGSRVEVSDPSSGVVFSTESGTTSVVSINSAGLVTAMGEGREVVAATWGNETTRMEVTVDLPDCSDGENNDSDGLTDSADAGCLDEADESEQAACEDGVDNDGDGHTDLSDPECKSVSDHSEGVECSDGLDNDRDGLVDEAADPGCRSAGADREAAQCQDGINNDGQVGIDFDGGASVLGAGSAGAPDPQCTTPWGNLESSGGGVGCGIGPELALALLLLTRRDARRRQRDDARD